MTVTDLQIGPYESYLQADPVMPATPLKGDEAEILAENILGPRRGQDLFAMVAALVARRRVGPLSVLYSGDSQLHATLSERAGSALDRGFAMRAGAPFRSTEPAVLHAMRALAALGLALADDEPRRQWLKAALAWHEEARSAPAEVSVPWAPADLAGQDRRLRERLELLAEVAGQRWQSGHVFSAAVTLRCLANPTVEPSAAMLVTDPGQASSPSRHHRRRLRAASSSITVLFDQGQDGIEAKLRATVANSLPGCLIADPERMSLFAADQGFQLALDRAWRQAGHDRGGGTVLWSVETAVGPERYAVGESLGAAFAVIVDDTSRLRRPLASLLVIRRLVGRNAVIGKIDDLGYMQGVEGYDTKLRAFGQDGKIIIPQTDHQKAEAAAEPIEPKPQLVPVGRWTQAARKARGSSRSVIIRDSVIVGVLAVLVIAGAVIARLSGTDAAQHRLAVSSQLAAQSETLDTTDPVRAALLAAASWKIAPTPAARDSLLDVLAQPVRGVLGTGRSPVYGAGFSPDGKLLATAEADGMTQVWNLATHREVGRPFHLASSDNLKATAIFSPNGKLLAAVATARPDVKSPVELRDATTGRLIATLSTSDNTEADALAFSPDSQILAMSTIYGTAYLWNVATKRLIGSPLVDHSGIMSGLAFSPDGKILATASVGGKVLLWDVATHSQIGGPLDVDSHNGWTTVTFSPDGAILATGTRGANGQTSFWDVATHRRIGATLNTDCSPNDEAFSPDGQLLAVACTDGNTRLFDVLNRLEVNPPLTINQNQVWAVAFSPVGATVATGTGTGAVILWDTDAFRQVGGYMNARTSPAGVAYSSNGKLLATADSGGTLRLWHAATHKEIGAPLISDKQNLWNAAFSPDGKLVATASDDGTARIWNVATRKQIGPPMAIRNQTVFSVAFSPNGKILASGGTDDNARLWDTSTHREIGKPLNTDGAVIHLAFSPDGQMLATGTYEGTDELWSVASHRLIARLTTNGGLFGPLAFSPDGKIVATASQEGVIQLWSTATHREIGEPFEADDMSVIGIAFSHDGQLLATGSVDGTARLWDFATHQEIGGPISSQLSIAGMAFNPTGKILAIVSGNYASLLNVAIPDRPLPMVCDIAADKSLSLRRWRSIGLQAQKICPR